MGCWGAGAVRRGGVRAPSVAGRSAARRRPHHGLAATPAFSSMFSVHHSPTWRLSRANPLSPTKPSLQRTALHIACAENSPASVKLLVEAGADVNVMDRWGSGPLDEAVRVGARSVIEFLLKHNAPTYKVEERAGEFLSAAARGDCDKLRHMLQHGVDVDSQDYDKRSALMLAAAAGHARAVNTLLGANASPGLQDNFGGSALTEAIKARRSDLVGLLAQNGATLGWPEERVASELCNVVAAGDCEKLALYIQAGANVDSADYDKRVALHIAVSGL